MSAAGDVCARVRAWAGAEPGRTAVVDPDGRRTSYAALETRVRRIAAGLAELGLARGERALVFVPPGSALVALFHALLRLGAVPVVIDPGMGRRALLDCVRRVRARALVGVPRAHLARALFPDAFRTVELAVTVGRRAGWPGTTLAALEGRRGEEPALPAPRPEDAAAILFTSGSTGPAKGVSYTHGMLAAQAALLERLYALEPGEVDLACFPLFALFDHALGMTSVFPPLDASHPARCDPAAIHAALERERATFAFGSPAIWTRVLAWSLRRGARASTLRRLTVAGAPVAPRLLHGLGELLPPGGEVHTPYGATEALPVTSLSGAELRAGLDARCERGEGTCVGRPVPGVLVRLVRITDEPLDALAPCSDGEAGEICVRGPIVTPGYALDEGATRAARIPGAPGEAAWHRMGDVGRFDSDGRLWLLGRKSHRLETADGAFLPVPLENVCNTVAGVRQSALVGVGARGGERACLVVELEPGARRRAVRHALERRAREADVGPPLAGVLFRRSFPVDVRHNAKIKRGELKRWAERKLS